MTRNTFLSFFIALILMNSFGHPICFAEVEEHHEPHHENSSQVNESAIGPDRAVTEASPKFGFKLSAMAQERLGIKVQTLDKLAPISLPRSALVFYQDQVGVYCLQNGWFRLVPVKILQGDKSIIQIESAELNMGDTLVTSGVAFLRVAEMEVFGESSGGHVH